MDPTQAALAVVSLLLGGGMITGLVALLKVAPERADLAVTAAQKAVMALTETLEQFQSDLAAAHTEIARLRSELSSTLTQVEQLTARVRELESELAASRQRL